MNCQRWVWLNSSKAHFQDQKGTKRSNWGILLLFDNFPQNCSITLFLCLQLHVFQYDFDKLLRDGFDLMTRPVRNVSFVPFSENSLYYLVVLKSCTKISMVLSHFQGQKVPMWYIWANISNTLHALQFTSWTLKFDKLAWSKFNHPSLQFGLLLRGHVY